MLSASANAQDSTSAKYYAGILSSIQYDSLGRVTQSVNTRAALEIKTQFFGFEFTGRAIWRSQGGSFGQGWISKQLGSFKISGGYLPRPITLMTRANPITSGGHFESSANSVIVGAGTGLRLDYTGNKFSSYAGLYYLENSRRPELNVALSIALGNVEFRTGGFYSKDGYGASFTTIHPLFSLQGYYEKDSIASMSASINAPVTPYVSWVYNHKMHYSKTLEVGVVKAIDVKTMHIAGLIGFGYQIKPVKSYNLYIFAHIP